MKTVRFLLVPVALCLSAIFPTAAAQAMTAAHVEHPIRVNACNPERNISYNYSGYTPGYYPGGYGYGRYWGWPSVYGSMYYQAPVENDPTLGIDYVNATGVVMKEIEFGLIVRGSARRRSARRRHVLARAPRSSTSSALSQERFSDWARRCKMRSAADPFPTERSGRTPICPRYTRACTAA